MKKTFSFSLILFLFVLFALVNFFRNKEDENFKKLLTEDTYNVISVAFWNVENLFDTIDNLKKFDEDFTPHGKLKWNTKKYSDKINKIAHVISEIGISKTKRPPALVGLCEIENRNVLIDLVNHPKLKPYGYKIIHKNSPDGRGIDVAMLYRKSIIKNIKYDYHFIDLTKVGGKYTRDILTVSAKIEQEQFYFAFNHWPSRRGGQRSTSKLRMHVAKVLNNYTDSLISLNKNAKIIIMGDFNDDPENSSIKKGLGACSNHFKTCDLYNLTSSLSSQGLGTLAYRDRWNLFDQVIISNSLLKKDKGYYALSAYIFDEDYLHVESGRFRGYPFRTFAGGIYQGGYSDHFPVYTILLKSKDEL